MKHNVVQLYSKSFIEAIYYYGLNRDFKVNSCLVDIILGMIDTFAGASIKIYSVLNHQYRLPIPALYDKYFLLMNRLRQ